MKKIELFSQKWCERRDWWYEQLAKQVSHLPLLKIKSLCEVLRISAVELVEITICGEMYTSSNTKEDIANPKERKPVIFQQWHDRDKEDGGGQSHYDTECGKFVKMTVYVFGRAFGTPLEPLVIYTNSIQDGNRIPFPPVYESIQMIETRNIATYKVLERYPSSK